MRSRGPRRGCPYPFRDPANVGGHGAIFGTYVDIVAVGNRPRPVAPAAAD